MAWILDEGGNCLGNRFRTIPSAAVRVVVVRVVVRVAVQVIV